MTDQLENSAQLVAAVRLEAAEHPDFVYTDEYQTDKYGVACEYIDRETLEGKCLIGRAALRAGIDSQSLIAVNTSPIIRITQKLIKESDSRSSLWLSKVQELQDKGVAWGVAVSTADKLYNNL